MTIEAFPFDNSQIQNELQWQRLVRTFVPDGVDTIPSGGSLKIAATGGLGISIAQGHAVLRGFFYRQVGSLTRTAIVNTTNLPRIDRAVLRCNLDSNLYEPTILPGTPASAPVPPAMSYTETLFDMPLGRIRVEPNDTISQVIDERRFLGRPVVYCTSQNRPDPQGRPLVAYETDLRRVISTDGSGSWNVGFGDETYRVAYAYSGDNGSTTKTTWDSTLDNTGTPTLSVTFTAPPSGRAIVRVGAFLSNNTSNADTYCAVRLRSAAGADYWELGDSTVAADRQISYNGAPNTGGDGVAGSSCSNNFYATSLVPGTVYTATLYYRVSGAGQTATIDDRSIEIMPVP